MSVTSPSAVSYMPWLVEHHGNKFVVICDSFGPPYGPRLWLFVDGSIGVPADMTLPIRRFKTLREAWRQAHNLNRQFYAPQRRPRTQKGSHES